MSRIGTAKTVGTIRHSAASKSRGFVRASKSRQTSRMCGSMVTGAHTRVAIQGRRRRGGVIRYTGAMRLIVSMLLAGMAVTHAQQPNLAAQREAMKKLEFLAGKWSGEGTVVRGP